MNFYYQADFEQCKDELEFARHKNNELEEIINIERKKLKEKDEELEVISCISQQLC